MDVVTVEEDGRIELPLPLRERWGLRPGTRLALEEGPGERGLYLSLIWEEPTTGASDAAGLTSAEHRRRGFLVDKQSSRALTPAETSELDELERRLDRHLDVVAPLPFGTIRQLEEIAAHVGASPDRAEIEPTEPSG